MFSKVFILLLVVGLLFAVAPKQAQAAAIVNDEAGLRAALAGTETQIELGASFTLAATVDVNRSVSIDGKGFTITGPSSYHGLNVGANGVTIQNLTITGSAGHNLQFYRVTGGVVNDVVLSNAGKSGMTVNGSVVTISNVTTTNNLWGGINVDQGVGVTEIPLLTVTNVTTHTSPGAITPAIWVDKGNAAWVSADGLYTIVTGTPLVFFDNAEFVAAQQALTGTTLAMDPAANTATICGLSGTTTVAVKVGPVDKLQAYDIRVNYDPAEVEILSVVDGDVFGDVFGVPDLGADDGQLSLAITELGAPITDLNGGDLVLITLKHKTTGSTVLTLDPSSLLLQSDGEEVPEYIDYPYTITQATSTFTVGDPVVAIGVTEYCTLGEAVTAAVTGDTLKVLRNFSVSSTTAINKQITLDTNGKTITNTSDFNSMFMVYGAADLTITGAGVLDSPSATTIALMNFFTTGQPKVTLQDATISGLRSVTILGNTNVGGTDPYPSLFTVAGGSTTDGIYLRGKGAELVVSGGLVTCSGDLYVCPAPIFGSRTPWDEGTKITISGGTVRSLEGVAIYHPQDGDLTITGGWIEGATGIVMKSGNLDVSGSPVILADGAYAEPVDYSSEPFSTGDAILVFGGAGEPGYEYAGDITVNIHDMLSSDTMGYILSGDAYFIREFSDSATATRTSSIKISSGELYGFGYNVTPSDSKPLLVSQALLTDSQASVPTATLLLNGGWYNRDPQLYVFPPLETYAALSSQEEDGFMIRAMYPFAIVRGTETLLFPTLKDAVDGALANETITLRLDHTATCPADPAIVTKTLTIEMNGFDYDWPCAVGYYDAPLVVDAGALTIQDSSVAETGSIKGWNGKMGYPDGRGAAIKIISGSATLESGTLTAGDTSVRIEGNNDIATWNTPRPAAFTINGGIVADSIYLTGNGAAATINDGLVTTPGPFAAIQGNGNANNGGTQITINGGNVTADGMAIYHPQQGDLNINGGTITAGSPIQMKAGNLTITNGTITANQTTWVEVPALTGNSAEWTGDAIFIFNRDGYGVGEMNVTISGGTITSASGYALREYTAPGETSRLGVATISGGTFDGGAPGAVIFTTNFDANLDLQPGSWYSSAPAAYVFSPLRTYWDSTKLMYGIQAIPPILNVELNIEYFDLQTAVDAATAGNTLKFQLDYTIPSTVTVDKALKLDLNGKVASYTLSEDSLSDYVLQVTTGAALTVKDTQTGGTIRAVGGDGRGIEVLNGSLLVESGTIQGQTSSVSVRAGSSATIAGGYIGGVNGTIQYSGIGVTGSGATLTVTGGTIESNDFAIYGNGKAENWGTIINIQGGEVISTGPVGEAIYHPQSGTLNISGGTITGHQGVEMRNGTLNVTGGTIHAIGNYVAVPDLKGGWSTDTGDAIFVGTSGTGYGNVNVNISSTTAVITSDNGFALREAVLEGVTFTNTKKINATGGTFTGGAGAAVTFSDLLVAANTAGTSDLDLLPGSFYNVDPAAFVYTPYGTYLDTTKDPDMYGIHLLPTISGLVTMQGRLDVSAGVPLALNGTAYTATSNEMTDVNYAFIGVEPGTYTFTTTQARYLNVSKQIVIEGLDFRTLTSLRLRAGNAMWIGDNLIDLDDAGKVGGEWGNSLCPITDVTNNCGDVNFDGLVNIRDLALVGGNMDLTSATAYNLWIPVTTP